VKLEKNYTVTFWKYLIEPSKDFSKNRKDVLTAFSNFKNRDEGIFQRGVSKRLQETGKSNPEGLGHQGFGVL